MDPVVDLQRHQIGEPSTLKIMPYLVLLLNFPVLWCIRWRGCSRAVSAQQQHMQIESHAANHIRLETLLDSHSYRPSNFCCILDWFIFFAVVNDIDITLVGGESATLYSLRWLSREIYIPKMKTRRMYWAFQWYSLWHWVHSVMPQRSKTWPRH